MPNRNEVYKCVVCGNIVEILNGTNVPLVCCGKDMDLQPEKTSDEGMEKHVPVIEKTEKGFKVKVGSVPHPMEEAHYIQWVELIVGEKVYKEFLKPGMAPEAEFCIDAESVTAREYCNIHGLWKK